MPPDPLGRAITVVRGGLALAGVAGVLITLSPLADIVDGPGAAPGEGVHTAAVGTSVAVIASLGAAVIFAAAALRLLWLHMVALVLGTGLALVAAFLVISARTSDQFADGAELTMRGGGLLLVAGFWTALAGVARVMASTASTTAAAVYEVCSSNGKRTGSG